MVSKTKSMAVPLAPLIGKLTLGLAAAGSSLAGCASLIATPTDPASTSSAQVEGEPSPGGPARRTPPAIRVDPTLELPRAKLEGDTDESVLTLRAPQPDAFLTQLVADVFAAITAESNQDLGALLTSNSIARFPGDVVTSARASWSRRFTNSDFTSLHPTRIYRPRSLFIYRGNHLANVGNRHTIEVEARSTDFVVVVPIHGQSAAGKRLFGSEIQLLVRPDNGQLRVAEFYENYRAR